MFRKVYIFLENALFFLSMFLCCVGLLAMILGVENRGTDTMMQIAFMVSYASLLMFWIRHTCNP